jgi:integrase
MMMLLATYGLRGIEVIRLRLDNIDWRKQLLHIRRRKAGNNTSYPLDPSVAAAVVAYLRHSRPTGTQSHPLAHREVFLSARPPFGPLQYTANLGVRVRHYIGEAAVTIDRPGTHTFRYSCAQRLLDGGSPLKVVGDYLGHNHPDSTQRYTKIAIEQLRDVARGDGEDLL